jgi:ribosomal protein L37AE/L43A
MQKDSKKHETPTDANNVLAVRTYRCVHCGKKVERHSDKHWINSYCDETGKKSRLILTNV